MINPKALASNCIKERTADYMMGLLTHLEHQLIELGVGQAQAEQAAERTVDYIREVYSGDTIYIPKGVELKSLVKQHEIWKELNGCNHREVAKRHGVTLQWVYEIDRRITKMLKDELQADLFSSR